MYKLINSYKYSESNIAASEDKLSQYDRRDVMSINNHDYAVRYNTIYTGEDADPWDMWNEFRFSISRLSPYDDADYAYCFGSQGSIKIYRDGKLVDKASYMNSDDMGVENENWCQVVIDETLKLLERMNHSIERRMVYNSKQTGNTNIVGAKELDTYAASIEVSLHGLVYQTDTNGDAHIDDSNWEGRSLDNSWADYEYGVWLGDDDTIIQAIEDLVAPLMPETSDTSYKLSGFAELHYDIDGIEYEDTVYKDDESFEREIYTDNAVVTWDIEGSYLVDFDFTE